MQHMHPISLYGYCLFQKGFEVVMGQLVCCLSCMSLKCAEKLIKHYCLWCKLMLLLAN